MILCALTDLPAGTARGFCVGGPAGGRAIVVVRSRGGSVYGYENRCPHTGVNLDWVPDRFMDADGLQMQCATHGALFRIEDGHCLHGPCAGRGLTPVPVRIEAGQIVLEAPHGTSGP
jgi:nitrite reductase/ring-hydroxylating ferredoxin subunit